MRLRIWKALVLGIFAGVTAFGALAAEPASRSNLLLIYVDDLGYGDLGSYGHPVLQTPNLDRLAEQGVRLTNYYAPSALCSPSRAALLTGRHPYRTGIQSWIPAGTGIYLRIRELTLAELLRAEGYGTALVGKWHLNSDLGSPTEPQPKTTRALTISMAITPSKRPRIAIPTTSTAIGRSCPCRKAIRLSCMWRRL